MVSIMYNIHPFGIYIYICILIYKGFHWKVSVQSRSKTNICPGIFVLGAQMLDIGEKCNAF